jgi:hypothetical protein
MKTKAIFKTPDSISYKNYEREIYMSEYTTIPKEKYRRMVISEVLGWGISVFLLLITLLR